MKKSKSKEGSGGDQEQDESDGEEDHTEVRSDVSDMESHRSTHSLTILFCFTLFIVKSHRILGGQIKWWGEHTPLLIGKLLWVIRKHKRAYATRSHTVVEKGGEKRKKEGMCGGTHTTFLFCFREERNRVLTLS